MKRMYIWYIAILLHVEICIGAAEMIKKELPQEIIMPCVGAVKGADLILRIPITEIEPLTGRSFEALGQEAFQKGLPLALVHLLWKKRPSDTFLVAEVLDMVALLRAYGDYKVENFVDSDAVNATLSAAIQKFVLIKAPLVQETVKVPYGGYELNVQISRPSRDLLQAGPFLLGPDSQRSMILLSTKYLFTI